MGKVTYPGRKQIFRQVENWIVQRDRLGLITESTKGEIPLLQLVMKQGQLVRETETLGMIRDRTTASVASLPAPVRQFDNPASISVELSTALSDLTDRTRHQKQPA
jgi:nicotinate phosphoribosyltransferase